MTKDPQSKSKMETSNAIAEIPYIPNESDLLCPDEGACAEIQDLAVEQKTFRIRLADTEEGRNSASMLINKMYSWRGYSTSHQIRESPNRITLTASENHSVIGTLSLGIDSPIGLLADDIFKDEIDIFRNRGGKVCEFSKLAFDPGVRSKLILASLFHVAFIYARRIQKCTDLFIEINPRHRRFYERMLGFKRRGEIKTNPRVNAPAFLLWLDLGYAEFQIRKLGGASSHPGPEKSLYPYFFSPREEEGITHRLSRLG